MRKNRVKTYETNSLKPLPFQLERFSPFLQEVFLLIIIFLFYQVFLLQQFFVFVYFPQLPLQLQLPALQIHHLSRAGLQRNRRRRMTIPFFCHAFISKNKYVATCVWYKRELHSVNNISNLSPGPAASKKSIPSSLFPSITTRVSCRVNIKNNLRKYTLYFLFWEAVVSSIAKMIFFVSWLPP